MNYKWFLSDPEIIDGKRVDLTLGLRGSIRYYNDLTAPGIGNVTFIRQLTWSCLALYYADELNEGSSKLANAIEAFGLKAYFNNCKSDEYDYKGIRAFSRTTWDELNSYKSLSVKNNYVQITYRQNTTRSLPYRTGLGLVNDESVFSKFILSTSGRELIENLESQYGSYKHGYILKKWVQENKSSTSMNTVSERFGPISTKSEKENIYTRLNSFVHEGVEGLRGDVNRRERIIKIFNAEKEIKDFKTTLSILEKHDYSDLYSDMKKAIEFYKMLYCGQIILSKIFNELLNSKCLDVQKDKYQDEIKNLKNAALTYLNNDSKHILNLDAKIFATTITNGTNEEIIIDIVNRDRRVSEILDGKIIKGPLYRDDIAQIKFTLVETPKTFINFYKIWSECNEKK